METDRTIEIREAGSSGDAAQALADMIRRESRAGRLVPETAIAPGAGAPVPPAADRERLIRDALDRHPDIREMVAGDGSRHYRSTRFMTAAYASLMMKKRGDPLELIAETVREYTAVHRKPVPLDLFTHSPFDMTLPDLESWLERMHSRDAYGDIARTRTSTARAFLYSTRILDPEHASMLAEWLALDQADNP